MLPSKIRLTHRIPVRSCLTSNRSVVLRYLVNISFCVKMDEDVKNAPCSENLPKLTARELTQHFFTRFFETRPSHKEDEKMSEKTLEKVCDFYYKKCFVYQRIVTKSSPTVKMAREIFQLFTPLHSSISLQELTFAVETHLLEYEMSDNEDLKVMELFVMDPEFKERLREHRETPEQNWKLQYYKYRTQEECIEKLLLCYFHAERIKDQLLRETAKQKKTVTKKAGTDSAGKSKDQEVETKGHDDIEKSEDKMDTESTDNTGKTEHKIESKEADDSGGSEDKELETKNAEKSEDIVKIERSDKVEESDDSMEIENSDTVLESEDKVEAGSIDAGSTDQVENKGADSIGNVEKSEDSMEIEDADHFEFKGRKYKRNSLSYYFYSDEALSPKLLFRFRLEFLDTCRFLIRSCMMFYRKIQIPFLVPSEETLEKFRKIEEYKRYRRSKIGRRPFPDISHLIPPKVESDVSK